MKLNFYANGDAANHGCEAISRSLTKIFNDDGFNISFFSKNINSDIKYGLGNLATFLPIRNSDRKSWIGYLNYWLIQHIKASDLNYYRLIYSDFIKNVSPGQLYISIGGDNYSYGKSDWLAYLNENITKRGGKTVLLGCSIYDHIQDNALISDLSRYHTIISRESITYDALKKADINSKLFLIPDPAFQLDTKLLPLPAGWAEGNTVGINISPMVMGLECCAGMALRNYERLIEHILNDTDMTVALIPHVVWWDNDDRKPLERIYERFKERGRVVMIKDCGAEELKGYIARCRFMVAARTHASIAAYSSMVPTLVVGYSVKARGIAKDLFGSHESYVTSVQSFSKEDDLTRAFIWIQEHEKSIRDRLGFVIPKYSEKVLSMKSILKQICTE